MKKLLLLLSIVILTISCKKEVVEVEKKEPVIENPLSVKINYGYINPVHAVFIDLNKNVELTEKDVKCAMPSTFGKVKLCVYLPINNTTELLFTYNNISRSIIINKSETIYITYSLYKLNLSLIDIKQNSR